MFETKSTTVPITREMVKAAYRKVNANHGSAGVDKESLEEYQADLLSNLYVLWNRLSSGSYFPKPVLEVMILKTNGSGSKRTLGIPTVSDRIAQQVVKTYLEPRLEQIFHNNSYGYRPGRSAHDALDKIRKNVIDYAWVVDMDIKSFFDEVSHELLLKALECHVKEKWIKMYIKRWLESPVQKRDGSLIPKEGKGTPQGGVISPLLSNLFLHYVLDKWLDKHYPHLAFVRYADDIVIHCNSENESHEVLAAIRHRLEECKLRLNEEKTKIVYCKNHRRTSRNDYAKKFDFSGFTFKPMSFPSRWTGTYLGFDCSISQKAQTRIVTGWKKHNFHRRSTLSIQEIAIEMNPRIRGIINYYGRYNKSELQKLIRHFHFRLAKWVLNKYKGLKGSYRKAYKWINEIRVSYPTMFYHWLIFK